MNGRRLETDEEATDSDRRRMQAYGSGAFLPQSEDSSPGLAQRTQNLLNFLEMFKDTPQFAEIFSMVMSNSFFRESVMNGRRLDDDRRRFESGYFHLPSEDSSPGLAQRTQNLVNFLEMFKDTPQFAEIFSMVMNNSFFRESVMNG